MCVKRFEQAVLDYSGQVLGGLRLGIGGTLQRRGEPIWHSRTSVEQAPDPTNQVLPVVAS